MYYLRQLFIFSLLSLFFFSCGGERELIPEKSNRVLVTHSPYNYFVERLTLGEVEAVVLVPPGASAHTFEPTPKQVMKAGSADLWFMTGEPFELQALTPLKSHSPSMVTQDLRKGLEIKAIPNSQCAHHDHVDLHFWLSPKLMAEQVHTMAEALAEVYPDLKEMIYNEEMQLKKDLDQLFTTMKTILDLAPNKAIMVGHAAYGYLCRDFGLEQISIECEGKEPTPQKLTQIIQNARNKNITRIFVQPQHGKKGAEVIAKEIGAEVMELDPYAHNYFENMRKIAWAFGGY